MAATSEIALYHKRDELSPRRIDVCCCLPPLAVGYLSCLLTLAEGLVLLFHMTEVIGHSEGFFPALYDGHNPFDDVLKVILWIVAVTDLVMFVVGVLGLYLSVHLAPDIIRRGMSNGIAGNTPVVAIGALLLWRVLVTAGAAPWVGIYLAFKDPDTGDNLAYILATLAFIFINIVFAYGLAQVLRAAVLEREYINERMEQRSAEEWRIFRRGLARHDVGLDDAEPYLFDCLPLEFAMRVWCLVLIVACLVWFIRVVSSDTTIGGWAFVEEMPYVSKTQWLECTAYLLGVVGAVAGIAGLIGHTSARNHEALTLSDGPGRTAEYYIELDAAIKARKRSTFALLTFFLLNLFRICCFVPMTGMALLAKDVCGVYVHGLSKHSSWTPWYLFGGTTLHCSAGDCGLLLFVVGMLIVDFYMLRGIYRLWAACRSFNAAIKEVNPGVYGTADM